MSDSLEVIDLGRRGYHETLALQRELRLERLDGRHPDDLLLLVEHPPTYTLGRGTRASSLPIPPEQLRQRGAEVVEIERGGDVTWHGPGQLVGYPIIHLGEHRPDLHWYLRTLESALISALETLGVTAGVEAGKTGVWTSGRKIASIGIHVKQWVTMHGFALNVHPELGWFDAIVPCGLSGVEMTSIARELAAADPASLWQPTASAVVDAFGNAFGTVPYQGEHARQQR